MGRVRVYIYTYVEREREREERSMEGTQEDSAETLDALPLVPNVEEEEEEDVEGGGDASRKLAGVKKKKKKNNASAAREVKDDNAGADKTKMVDEALLKRTMTSVSVGGGAAGKREKKPAAVGAVGAPAERKQNNKNSSNTNNAAGGSGAAQSESVSPPELSVQHNTEGGGAGVGAGASPTYKRITSLESRGSKESMGWLSNVLGDGLRDKMPGKTATEAAKGKAAQVRRTASAPRRPATVEGQASITLAHRGVTTKIQHVFVDSDDENTHDDATALENHAGDDDAAETATAAGGGGGGNASRRHPSSATKAKKRKKRSISLNDAINQQSHQDVLMKTKSYEYAKLANNKFNMLFETNANFSDIVGRRIPIVNDAWRKKFAGTSSSLIQTWANEYCGRNSPGPWSVEAVTEPCLRCDIYHCQHTVQYTEYEEDEESRLKLFRSVSAQKVLKLSNFQKHGFNGSLPGRVLMKNCAEWTPNAQLYTKTEFMRRVGAVESGVWYILAVPVLEMSSLHKPVCVIEIVRLGPDASASQDARLRGAMANVSVANDIEFLNSVLRPLGLVAPAIPQELFGVTFEQLCPPMPSVSPESLSGVPESSAATIGEPSTSSSSPPQPQPQEALTAKLLRSDEREAMERVVTQATANGDIEFAQFWYYLDKRKGSLVTNGMPYAISDKAATDGWDMDEEGPIVTSVSIPGAGSVKNDDDNNNDDIREPDAEELQKLGLQPYGRLAAYRIACEERAMPTTTGGPVGAALQSFKTNAKAKIIYWPDVQNASSTKFVMAHTAASLHVESVAAIVVPNILIDAQNMRAPDIPSGCVVLELVLPPDADRDVSKNAISKVVNMAHLEGRALQLAYKQRQNEEEEKQLLKEKQQLQLNVGR